MANISGILVFFTLIGDNLWMLSYWLMLSCWNYAGLINVQCHEDFKKCAKKVKKSGKIGFSKECPFERAMPTMIQGMDVGILLSQIGVSNTDL